MRGVGDIGLEVEVLEEPIQDASGPGSTFSERSISNQCVEG